MQFNLSIERTNQYIWLVYFGTLPFIACMIAAMADLPYPEINVSLIDVAISYGLIIVSFMAGVHWGSFLYNSEKSPMNLFISSNVITIFVWFIYLTGNDILALIILSMAFVILYAIDLRLHQCGLISDHYLNTRRNVTGVVLLCLIGLLVSA